MNDDTTFEDLVETYLDALRDGSAPGVEEFAGQHPEYADRLRDLLPLMVRMEDCATETATARKQAVSRDEFPDMTGSDYRLIRRIGAGGMGAVRSEYTGEGTPPERGEILHVVSVFCINSRRKGPAIQAKPTGIRAGAHKRDVYAKRSLGISNICLFSLKINILIKKI